MIWQNELTKCLNIAYPVIQAPMLGVTTPAMVAAIANKGGLGSLPVGGLSPENTTELIRSTKSLTALPFAVNLFANPLPTTPDKEVLQTMQDLLNRFCIENGFTYERQSFDSFTFNSYTDQIDCLLDEHIPVVSFTFGTLDSNSIQALKQKGTILIGTATCLKEAKILDEMGVNIITAQGIEAGGHRGTFLEEEPIPMIGTIALTAELAINIKKPIVAAGGISNGSAIRAALALGAKAVQIGTAFIASNESAAIPAYKEALQNAKDTDSVLTKAFSGRWARGLRNKLMSAIEDAGIKIPEFPIQVHLTLPIRVEAQRKNNKEFTPCWSGQSSSKPEMKPIAEIFTALIQQAEEVA